MRHLRLIIAYEGTRYAGWQVQPGQHTIQGEIQRVLEQLTQYKTHVRGAGRTDAGVHAEGQIAIFETDSTLTPFRFLRGLNALLPEDISIYKVEEIDANYNVRRGNHGKHYQYRIRRAREIDPLDHRRSWHIHGDLDIHAMAKAAKHLVGTHDFSAFRAADCERETTIRTLFRVTVSPQGSDLLIDVMGTAFLKNMVRIIAGTLVDVGRGRLSEADVQELLSHPDRKKGGVTAPAKGLTLKRVILASEHTPL